VVFSATGFLHDGPLDPPHGVTIVSLGDAAHPPSYDARRARVTNAVHQVMVKEGEGSAVTLAAGSYWVWSSNTVTINAAPCAPTTLTDVRPVR